jgi:SAM-dependent methyltransferase
VVAMSDIPEKTNFSAAKSFVDFGLEDHERGHRESVSGPGSALAAAAPTLALLDRAIRKYSVDSILDLGCGDWNWMRHAEWYQTEARVNYVGWEANQTIVNRLNEQFAKPGVAFELMDINAESLPPAKLIICRDVLFHLPIHLAAALVERIRQARCLFIATTFPMAEKNGNIEQYLPIPGWGFHRINLDIPPFDLKAYLRDREIEPLCCARSVSLYDLNG